MGMLYAAIPVPAFSSPMCPKKQFDYGDLLLINVIIVLLFADVLPLNTASEGYHFA